MSDQALYPDHDNGIPLALVVALTNRRDMKLFKVTLEAQQMIPADRRGFWIASKSRPLIWAS